MIISATKQAKQTRQRKSDVHLKSLGIWEWLTKPASEIKNQTEQRQARLISGLLSLLIGLSILGSIWDAPISVATIVLIGIYALSRTRHALLAGILALVTLSIPPYYALLTAATLTAESVAFTLSWAVLPIILSSLVLAIPHIIVISLVNILAIFSLLLFTALPRAGVVQGLGFVLTLAVIIVMSSWLRQRYLIHNRIEESRRIQRALRTANSELSAANREVRDFAYIIAHDLRTPLVNIVGFMDEVRYVLKHMTPIVQKYLPDMDEEDGKLMKEAFFSDLPEAVDFIDTSTNKMEHLIGQILQLSQVGQRELHPQLVKVRPLVAEVIDTMTYQLNKRDTWAVVNDVPDVIVDPLAFLQIISNLVDNAVKYLDASRSGMIEISGEVTDYETIFHVKDNGCGIPEADKDKVFQLFRRAANTENVRGHGMGLAYVQTLVQRHGGRVWFESTEGVGSTFSFSIAHHLERRITL